jgi:hypothetical protein
MREQAWCVSSGVDANAAIEELLLEAAALSAAATAKLEEACRLAELTEDWQFFRNNPTRCYHARKASPAELEQIEAQDAFNGMTLAPDCFVFCLCRIWRDASQLAMRPLFVTCPRLNDSESECMAAWPGAMDRLLFARDAWALL